LKSVLFGNAFKTKRKKMAILLSKQGVCSKKSMSTILKAEPQFYQMPNKPKGHFIYNLVHLPNEHFYQPNKSKIIKNKIK
jgi:hypothetical protein